MDRRLIESESAAARVASAAAWLGARRASAVWIVGARREPVDALVRRVASEQGAALGWERTTLDALAGRVAARALARRGLTPVAGTAVEALCARLLHRMRARDVARLGRYAAIADRPGLPRALASTLEELAHADLAPEVVRAHAPDLAALYAAYRDELPALGLADRATVLEHATATLREGRAVDVERAVLLLDVRVRSRLEADLVAALIARAPSALVTIPRGDDRTRALLCERVDLAIEPATHAVEVAPALRALQARIFEDARDAVASDEAVEILSAPGESRECVEIARRVLVAAREGTRFDRMAVLLRAPERYGVHLAEAFRRAGIPASFSRGARRPDPTGRALLALLACAAEGISARAFGEYLSLGVVPDAEGGAPPDAKGARARFVPADEELAASDDDADDESGLAPIDEDAYDETAPVRAGTLRAPRRWEQLIVEAAVIGGRDRWARRIEGAIAAARRAREDLEDPDDVEGRRHARRIADLEALRDFALPLVDALAALPGRATWSAWIDALSALATRALRDPRRVLAVLASLAPMGDVGPVDLAEVRTVLTPRLREEPARAPGDESVGQVLVCTIEEARGRELDVVFVPGLAEKLFPAKVIEDPLLLDATREAISEALATRRERGAEERLALRIALGAASKRVVASIPRIDVERARPRVPSFYALEIARAIEGRLPSYEELGRRAEIAGAARLGWPAPDHPELAIDAAEHDLSVLGGLVDLPPKARIGRAAYLVAASPIVARALRARWARWDKKRWRSQDGMVEPDEGVRAILAEHRLDRRAYSATALESFAMCPYKFYLRTIIRLEPREVPEPLEMLDPAQRGTLVHAAQFRLLVRLRDEGALPVTPETRARALEVLDEELDRVARTTAEELAPAIPKVWEDTLAAVRQDLREWLHRTSEDPSWVPSRFELAFGIPAGDERDAASLHEPVPLSIGMRLRGAIDLVEEREGTLRATDHKTGSAWTKPGQRVMGGEKLQPILYALALESIFPDRTVWGGRLYYCTDKGRYTEVEVPLDDDSRAAITKVTTTIDQHVRDGFLPPAPSEKACSFCDYAVICGPHERRRTMRKEGDRLVGIDSLRRMP
ncbi:PD-(D/E)XK nuclease family protein [Sandaracinus amylolyticus]|uniref:ATP-dependent nuclease, subunit B n=1 Tax=Sandaracinus amylolyticus TaxID=927083 RepID=A0A0F6SHU0_9BACT|nr:PD-(D/E)XK nuclease family protein [Sandaracinus amylolyticus]AKF11029.1 ATP-dependent nuclease, subunit B [Sandaracinus amylolyticus]